MHIFQNIKFFFLNQFLKNVGAVEEGGAEKTWEERLWRSGLLLNWGLVALRN